MKKSIVIVSLLLVGLLVTGCNGLIQIGPGFKSIDASDIIVTDARDVSGFTSIDMRTIGNVLISQGDHDSLTVKGSDNIVPLINTHVSNGALIIETDMFHNITGLNSTNMLTFTITVKDLSSLIVSGLGNVEMAALSTPSLAITMSGAGRVHIDQLALDDLNVIISGLGTVELTGAATSATIDITGAGNIDGGNLKIKTGSVSISGLGSATVWVTDQLNGSISGGGNVSYYGSPRVSTNTSGLGVYKSMGNK